MNTKEKKKIIIDACDECISKIAHVGIQPDKDMEGSFIRSVINETIEELRRTIRSIN